MLRMKILTVDHKRVQRITRQEGLRCTITGRRKQPSTARGKRELLQDDCPSHPDYWFNLLPED